MRIGIIGIGNIGGTLARKLRTIGHEVRVANSKGPSGVKAFADEIGAVAVDTRGAVYGVDLIILAIPLPAVSSLQKGLFDGVPKEVPVVDTSNYYPGMRDPQIADIDAGMPESVWVSNQLGRPVIKAFNNILADSLANLGCLENAPGRLAIAVAGEATAHKQMVMNLINEVGFDPVDAGTLDDSWRQQPSTPAYCCDHNSADMQKALAAAVMGDAPKKRDRLPELFAALGPSPSHAEVIAMNRSANAPG